MHAGTAPPDQAESSSGTFATALSHETSFVSAATNNTGQSRLSAGQKRPRPSARNAPPMTPPPQPRVSATASPTAVEPADWAIAMQQLAFFRELLALLPASCPALDPTARLELERLLPLCLSLAAAPAPADDEAEDSRRVRGYVRDLATACVGQYAVAACWHTRWKGRDSDALWSAGAYPPHPCLPTLMQKQLMHVWPVLTQ